MFHLTSLFSCAIYIVNIYIYINKLRETIDYTRGLLEGFFEISFVLGCMVYQRTGFMGSQASSKSVLPKEYCIVSLGCRGKVP